jgi:uncharacterized membrane protein YsdA (DUF1294 family)
MNAPFQQQRQRRGSLSLVALLLLIALLLLPGLASLRLFRSFDPRYSFGYLVAISGFTFWLYWHGKRRAETDGWRTPESTLHVAELLGGWPAAFLAQRIFRHKISKTSYQAAFWTIIAVYEVASFDFLHDWHYSRRALLLLHQ